MKKYICEHGIYETNDCGCKDTDNSCLRHYGYTQCTATRYVRADVAIRYARMMARNSNNEIHGWNIAVWHNRFGDKSNDFYKAKKEYEEAIAESKARDGAK